MSKTNIMQPFWDGLAKVLDIGNVYPLNPKVREIRKYYLDDHLSDAEKIASDWEMVGKDIKLSIDKCHERN